VELGDGRDRGAADVGSVGHLDTFVAFVLVFLDFVGDQPLNFRRTAATA